MIRQANSSAASSARGLFPRRAVLAILGVTLTVLGRVSLAQAQVSASLSGRVTDPSGALVPAATVIAKNDETGAERTAVTNAAGRYEVLALPVGLYEVRV